MTKSESAAHSETKTALLEAAQVLFSRKGFAAVSTREVAEAAHVNLGSIQYYFGSKGKLFIETIRHMMAVGGEVAKHRVSIPDCGTCVYSSGVSLAQFVKAFLSYLLVPEGQEPCRLMFREIFTETSEDPEMFEALVSTMSDEFARPLEEMLRKLLLVINPRQAQHEVSANVRSIIGQCSFYVTHRPFQERLMGVCLADSATINQIAQHISAFSLAGLGVDQKIISAVMEEVFLRKE